MAAILQARLAANNRPLHIFFGYREPVSWYLSLAGQFNLSLQLISKENISERIQRHHPWSNYRIDDVAEIFTKSFGINILDHQFDPQTAIGLLNSERATVVVYRFDKLDRVRDYIVENIDDRFVLTRERVNESAQYITDKANFFLPTEEIERVYADHWFRHFYTPLERDLLIESYTSSISAHRI
jgi:hypothetical protein